MTDTTSIAPETATPAIPLRRIRAWRPCAAQMRIIATTFPNGVPLTIAAALILHERGVDVVWGMLRLLTDAERIEFILFTLRQRQPHVVSLLRAADLPEHADAVATLRFDTPEQAGEAVPVFERAWDSARDNAWDSARDNAWDSARTSAWVSARVSAQDSAWDSAWDSARTSAWDSATREQVIWVAEHITARLAAGETVLS